MRITATSLSLLTLTSALSLQDPLSTQPQYLFSNPPVEDETYDIPSVHESAIMARRILHLSSLGTLVTSFPSSSSNTEEDQSTLQSRPSDVEGSPIGLMEYYADCEATGNPTMLAINIATPFRNYEAGSNISLSVRWWPKASNFYTTSNKPEIPTPHTPAALPRFSLFGRIEKIPTNELWRTLIPACFLKAHPDSVLWQPGNDISHQSEYVRLVVEHVYWFGGFGDRARIGWLPVEEWRGVTMREIEDCRLPGEKEKGKGLFGAWWREWL